MSKTKDLSLTSLRCSFCGKSKGEVKRLIAGPSIYICNECVVICNEILADETGGGSAKSEAAGPPPLLIGSFTCPKCRITFDLRAQQPEGFIK